MTNRERRFILHFAKPYIGNYILYFFLVCVMSVFSICSILSVNNFLQILFSSNASNNVVNASLLDDILRNIYDYFLQYGKQNALIIFTSMILIIYFFTDVFTYLSQYQMGYTRNKIIRNVRNELFSKYIRQDISFTSKYKKGDLISRISNDVIEYDENILKSIQTIINSSLIITLYIIILFYIDYFLTISILVLLPIIGTLTSFISRKLRRTSKHLQQKSGFLVSMIEETISGLRIIKNLAAIDLVNSRFHSFNESYTRLRNRIYYKVDLASPQSEFLSSIVVVILLLVGCKNVLAGNSLTPEMFIVYLILFALIIKPAKDASTSFYSLKRGTACMNRIMEIIESKPEIVEPKESKDFPELKKGIIFKDVVFSYKKDIPVIKNINVVFEKDKITAIVGASGSGKSTMIDLIDKFYNIDSGDILFDDVSIKDLSSKQIHKNISLVTQDTILLNDTVANNISFEDSSYSMDKIIDAAKTANSEEFIMKLPQKYNTNIGDKGNMLSGGQKQRISIARAVLKNAPILILDEATSALDTKSERLVQQAINDISKTKTTIIIAHRLSTIVNADKIIVLDKGEIKEIGTHNELYSQKGVYYKLCKMQEIK
ncbi:MAG: ABC transporter ATP-binding protein/permease [Bacteroidales bacterium]|jgi:subfamily B ATP-binding cassette protein MsbA|nr:ABC transporter ATP-binding protein/permease [Bacteroidales bacterium]